MDEVCKYQTKRLAASGLVCDRACLVSFIAGIGWSAGANRFHVYDGFDTGGELKMSLVAKLYTADVRPFPIPLLFSRGLYVDFETNGYECFVQYLETGR